MTMPTLRPAVPPAIRVCAEPVAVAGWLRTSVVPFWMPMIVVPAGIPLPLMPKPSERPTVLATVTRLEPAVVAALATVVWAPVVTELEPNK